jgi:4-diphosphocytidyl-2-C-methyl-D-erythritol kinase
MSGECGLVITVLAPAKINWTLEVLGRRSDGYHEVRTVLQTVDLHDELAFEHGAELSLEIAGRRKVSDDDLVLRAARALSAEAGMGGAGAAIRMTKRIPEGAGLGGGSSDAAATLRALNSLWGAELPDERLTEIAGGLGSDVAFFLRGGTALAEGRGERVTPLPDAPASWLVLVVPAVRMAEKTRRMYAALTADDFSDGSRTAAFAQRLAAGVRVDGGMLCNAFEREAFEVFEELPRLREWMLEAGAPTVHLCGAGPALFAPASGEPEARAIKGRMNRARKGERVYVVRTVAAGELSS